MPELTVSISQLFSVLSTAFMIWMLVDCIRNGRVRHKGWWIVFILFTQFVGSAVYFFIQGPWPKVKRYLFPQNTFPNYQAPPAPNYWTPPVPQPTQEREGFPSYEQGYPAQEQRAGSMFSESPQQQGNPVMLQPEYEQPQIAYPEPPQMQQF